MRPRTLLAIIAAVLALVLPLVLPVFQVTLLTNIAIVSITVIGLVLLTGISGLTSFGQAAFMGVGAYTTALLFTKLNVPPWFGMIAAAALCEGGVHQIDPNRPRGRMKTTSR